MCKYVQIYDCYVRFRPRKYLNPPQSHPGNFNCVAKGREEEGSPSLTAVSMLEWRGETSSTHNSECGKLYTLYICTNTTIIRINSWETNQSPTSGMFKRLTEILGLAQLNDWKIIKAPNSQGEAYVQWFLVGKNDIFIFGNVRQIIDGNVRQLRQLVFEHGVS